MKKTHRTIFAALFIITLLCMTISQGQESETAPFSRSDESDDICMIDGSGDTTEVTCNLSRDYIDIAKISRFHPDPGNVTLMMIFHGVITDYIDDPSIHYVMWFNTSYGKTLLDFSNGENMGYTYLFNDSVKIPPVGEVKITENTIQATYPVLATGYPDQNIEAQTWEEDGSMRWVDKVPSVKKGIGDDPKPIDFENPDKNDTDDVENTPGFPLVVFLFSIGFIILFFNWRRKE